MSDLGFNFVPDMGDRLAVVDNSDTAAKLLGYDDVSQTCIGFMTVYHDGEKDFETDVGEGKYRMAIWVEAWLAYRNKKPGQVTSVVFDHVALMAMEGYSGKIVWDDAGDPEKQNHGLTRSVRAGVAKGAVVELRFKLVRKRTSEPNQVGMEV